VTPAATWLAAAAAALSLALQLAVVALLLPLALRPAAPVVLALPGSVAGPGAARPAGRVTEEPATWTPPAPPAPTPPDPAPPPAEKTSPADRIKQLMDKSAQRWLTDDELAEYAAIATGDGSAALAAYRAARDRAGKARP
jgi:hypothetical protein